VYSRASNAVEKCHRLGFGGEPDLGIRGLVDFNRVLRGWTDPESAESAHLSTGSSGGGWHLMRIARLLSQVSMHCSVI
jgi:hypothetical protein